MRVADLIGALDLVGRVYRNSKGSGPADAVVKLIQQFEGAGDITLNEWVQDKQATPKRQTTKPRTSKKPTTSQEPIKRSVIKQTADDVLPRLEHAETHNSLREAISQAKLSAAEWQKLAKQVTGNPVRSGPAAREAIETHISNRLLLLDRAGSVKRLFS